MHAIDLVRKMKISRFMAQQYANPSGWFGGLITAVLLNRANRKCNEVVYNALDLDNDSRFLEIGFGGGDLLFDIARRSNCAEVFGLERSQAMVNRALNQTKKGRGLEQVVLQVGDIQSLPFTENRFNHLCSVNTVYFWPDLADCCKELSRVTASGGKVVLGFSSGKRLNSKGYSEQGFKFYKPEQIHSAMLDAGLNLEKVYQLDRPDKDLFYVPVYKKVI